MSKNNTEINTNIPPTKYKEASIRFREAWLEYQDREGLVKYEIVNMVKILEAEGLSRMEAIKKIIVDHKDLKGFSQKTIYRKLPDNMKNIELGRPNLSNEKLGEPNSSKASKTSKALEDFRQQKGTNVQGQSSITSGSNDTIDKTIDKDNDDNKDNNNSHDVKQEEVIYDNPEKIILQHEQQIIELQKENEELYQKIDELSMPFQREYMLPLKDQDLPLISYADPKTKEITTQVNEAKVKKIGLNKKR